MSTTLVESPKRRAKSTCEACGGKRGKHLPGCADVGCEYCGALVGHLNDCPQNQAEMPALCGMLCQGETDVTCTKPAGHLESQHLGRTARGSTLVWEADEDEEVVSVIETSVDGKEATVVIDGTSGAPAQPELIATPIEDRIRAIGRKETELDDARRVKKRASEYVKALEEEHELMVRALVAQVDGVQTLPLVAQVDGVQTLPLDVPSPRRAAAVEQEDDERGDAPLSGAERRALAMADDLSQHAPEPQAAPMQPLSAQQPGLYVSDEEGPED